MRSLTALSPLARIYTIDLANTSVRKKSPAMLGPVVSFLAGVVLALTIMAAMS